MTPVFIPIHHGPSGPLGRGDAALLGFMCVTMLPFLFRLAKDAARSGWDIAFAVGGMALVWAAMAVHLLAFAAGIIR